MLEKTYHIAQTTNLISTMDRRELSHYLIISLSHYLGRLAIGCIVVFMRYSREFTMFIGVYLYQNITNLFQNHFAKGEIGIFDLRATAHDLIVKS